MKLKYFSIIIVTFACAVLLGVLLVLLRYDQKITQQEMFGETTFLNTKNSQEIDKLSNWRTYINDERGIIFQHPPDWTILEEDGTEQLGPILSVAAPGADGPIFTVFENFNGGFECSQSATEDIGTVTLKNGTIVNVNVTKASEEEICNPEQLTEEQKNDRQVLVYIPEISTPTGIGILLYHFNVSKTPNGLEILRDILGTFEIRPHQ